MSSDISGAIISIAFVTFIWSIIASVWIAGWIVEKHEMKYHRELNEEDLSNENK